METAPNQNEVLDWIVEQIGVEDERFYMKVPWNYLRLRNVFRCGRMGKEICLSFANFEVSFDKRIVIIKRIKWLLSTPHRKWQYSWVTSICFLAAIPNVLSDMGCYDQLRSQNHKFKPTSNWVHEPRNRLVVKLWTYPINKMNNSYHRKTSWAVGERV